MKKGLTALVLGAGGNVSQGIMKALAASNLSCRIVAACISARAMGLYLAETAYVSPLAKDPAFFDWLVEICRKEDVHAVLSGTEPVLAVLSERKEELKKETGAVCIVSNPSSFFLGADKVATYRWLQSQGFRVPAYAISEDRKSMAALVNKCGYPLIAKPKYGKGSEGIIQVDNDNTLELVSGLDDYIVQEKVGDFLSEYTAGCFCDKDGCIKGVIVMHRELTCGTTTWAELGEFPEIRTEVIKIAKVLQPIGPCNMQFRMSEEGPVCLEFNVRFSGTTPLRTRLGFNEVEVAVRHFVLGEQAPDLPLVHRGFVMRYWNELYLPEEVFNDLHETGRLKNPKHFDMFIEDWGKAGALRK